MLSLVLQRNLNLAHLRKYFQPAALPADSCVMRVASDIDPLLGFIEPLPLLPDSQNLSLEGLPLVEKFIVVEKSRDLAMKEQFTDMSEKLLEFEALTICIID